MDNITEILVQKQKSGFDGLIRLGLVVAILLLCLVAGVFLQGTFFLVPLWASFVFLGLKLNDRLSVEYDYCLVEGSLDIAKVYSQKTRKEFISIDKDTVELVAPYGNAELNGFKDYKTYYATNKNEENKYVVVGVTKNTKDNKTKKCKVVIIGDDRLIQQYRKYMPRKVIVNE